MSEEEAVSAVPGRSGKAMRDEPWTVRPAVGADGAGVPPDVLAAAYRALEARSSNEILPLVFDSLLGERRGALDGTRQLRFGDDQPHIEVALQESGEQLDAGIAIVPFRETVVTVRHGGGTAEVRTDAYGRGALRVDHGPMSLCVSGVDDRALETVWVNV